MSWFPRAVRREIKPGANDPSIKVVGAILHVDAGDTRDLYNYFNGPSKGIESHFQIAKDGTVFQYRDTDREADANYKGNSFVEGGVRKGFVSIETQGLEHGEWTAQQLKSIKDLLLWLSDHHNFPLVVAPDPTGPGVGYHVLFGAPGAWTPVSKSCPGPKRIKQFRDILVPWFKSREPGKPAEPPKPARRVIDLSELLRAARRDPAAPTGSITPGASDDVKVVEAALVAEKLLAKTYADGSYGTKTVEAYAKWQRSKAGGGFVGDDADGLPGAESLRRLGARHGFEVRA